MLEEAGKQIRFEATQTINSDEIEEKLLRYFNFIQQQSTISIDTNLMIQRAEFDSTEIFIIIITYSPSCEARKAVN